MLFKDFQKLCLQETPEAVTSLSTSKYVAQPIVDKCHYVHNRIFIQGFPNTTTLKEVRQMFQSFGKIIDTNIVKPSGYRWCYGFVTFHPDSKTAVGRILDEISRGKAFSMKGKVLKVSRALFKPKKFIPLQRNRSSLSQDKPLFPLPPVGGRGKKRHGSRCNNQMDGCSYMHRNYTTFCQSCYNMGFSSQGVPNGNVMGGPVFNMGGSTLSVDTVYPVYKQRSCVVAPPDANPAFWGYFENAQPSVYNFGPHY